MSSDLDSPPALQLSAGRTEVFAQRVTARASFPGDGSLITAIIAALLEAFGNCPQPPSEIRAMVRSPTRLGDARMRVFVRRRLPLRQRRMTDQLVDAMRVEAQSLDDSAADEIILECQAEDVWN